MRERLAKMLEQAESQDALEKNENGRRRDEVPRTGAFE